MKSEHEGLRITTIVESPDGSICLDCEEPIYSDKYILILEQEVKGEIKFIRTLYWGCQSCFEYDPSNDI